MMFSSAFAQQCVKEEEKAKTDCSKDKFTAYEARLALVNQTLEGKGAGTQAKDGYRNLDHEKADLDRKIQVCNASRDKCAQTCEQEASGKRARMDYAGAQQDDQKKQNCQNGEPKKNEDEAKKTSGGMAEAMQALAALMQALGMGEEKPPETAQQPFCTENPTDPACKEDKPVDTSSTLTAGEFRRADEGAFADGDVGTEAAPAPGAAAQQTSSSPMGGAGMGLPMGGGGGVGTASARDKDSGKKSEFDGAPKINIAGGAMNGGGGSGGRGGGGSSLGKGSGNPIASRTGLNDENAANKVAAAAEDRLRGPASSNEPLGGISSVYYLDNFTKVEKRMITERNTLKEN